MDPDPTTGLALWPAPNQADKLIFDPTAQTEVLRVTIKPQELRLIHDFPKTLLDRCRGAHPW